MLVVMFEHRTIAIESDWPAVVKDIVIDELAQTRPILLVQTRNLIVVGFLKFWRVGVQHKSVVTNAFIRQPLSVGQRRAHSRRDQ